MQTIKNVPSRHAAVLVGSETLFLCHQIMTHMESHSYELILEVSIPEDIKKDILTDRGSLGRSHYFANQNEDQFTVPCLASGMKASFMADVWRSIPDSKEIGSPPQPPWGTPKVPIPPWKFNVEVTVLRIVHYRHLNLNEIARSFEQYILFGRGQEAHIMHSVLWQPEYDHVASLRSAPDWLHQHQLISSVTISIPDLPYSPWSTQWRCPFKDNSQITVLYFGFTEFRDTNGKLQNAIPELTIQVDHTWWFSTKVINYWHSQAGDTPLQIS